MKPSSPFQDINKDKAPEIAQSFSFQTMQDDLLALPKEELIIADKPLDKVAAKAPIEVNKPFVAPTTSEKVSVSDVGKNPFLTQEKKDVDAKKEPTKTPTPKEIYAAPVSSLYRNTVYLIVILIISITSLSGYYFWTNRNLEPAEIVSENPSEEPSAIQAPVEKYSLENPNYIVLDPSMITDAEIKNVVTTTAKELKDLSSESLYEFIFVDLNNNPIDFSTFATSAGLAFSPTLLSYLDKSFSLYIHNNDIGTRIGLTVATTNSPLLIEEMLKQEKTLSTDIALLFLDNLPEFITGEFGTSIYNDTTIRYLNVNAENTLSIDYAVTTDKFILSTSKNSERAVLDKITATTNIVPPIIEATETAPLEETTPIEDNTLITSTEDLTTQATPPEAEVTENLDNTQTLSE